MTEAPSPPSTKPARSRAFSDASVFARFRAALLALVALVVGGLGVLAVVESGRSRERAEQDAARQAETLANSLEVHAAATFRSAGLVVETMAEALQPMPGPEQAAALARRQLARTGIFRTIIAADAEGRVIFDAVADPEAVRARSLTVADRDYFRIHQHDPGRGTYISPPRLSRIDRGWFVAVSHRLEDEEGRFAGVVWGAIDLVYFDRYYATLDVGPGGTVTLWNREGSVLARHPHDEALLADPSAYAAQIPRITDGVRERTLRGPSPIDGMGRIVAVRAVEGLPLSVAVRMAEDDYLAAWRVASRQRMVDLACVAVLAGVLTLLLMRYLRRLEATTRALQDSDRRAHAIFDSTFQYMGLLTPEGTTLAVNQAGLSFTGARAEEVIGRPAWERAPWSTASPEAVQRFRDAIATAAAGTFVRFEVELDAGGDRRTIDYSIKPVLDDAGRVTLLIPEGRDVTDRKRIEDTLRASKVRLRSYLNAAMEGFFVADERGRLVDVNPAGCQTVGFERDEILSMSVPELMAEESTPGAGLRPAYDALMETGVFRGEVALRHKGGGVRRVDVSAVRLESGGYLGVIRDVTARREAEARLSALVQALPDAAFIIDEDGFYREALDKRAGELVGQHLYGLLPKPAAARILETVRRTVATGEPQAVEYTLESAAGKRWFDGRTAVLPPEFGPRRMVVLLARDVTERVRAAERLARAKEDAESASRTKSAFLATMSHELRTPLNAILGFSEIMIHEVFGPLGSARYREYAQHVHHSGTHLLELINDVLDMSKLEAGRYILDERELDLHDLLESCVALSRPTAEQAGVAMQTTLPPGLPKLLADGRAIRQVILNLLSNAVKFTPAGGRVTLAARAEEDGGLLVTVADTGIGIDEEALPHVTKAFHQADASISRRYGGTGLGLAISRHLVDLHGGRLTVESAVGQGTTVTVRLPAERAAPAESVGVR